MRYGNEAGVGEGDAGAAASIAPSCSSRRSSTASSRATTGRSAGSTAASSASASTTSTCCSCTGRCPAAGEFVSTWHTFEKLHADGRARAIGVSNFKPAHLETLLAESDDRAGGQPDRAQPARHAAGAARVRRRARHRDRVVEPARRQRCARARRAGRGRGRERGTASTPGQVVLRWHVQQGLVVIPRVGEPRAAWRRTSTSSTSSSATTTSRRSRPCSHGPDAGVDSDRTGHYARFDTRSCGSLTLAGSAPHPLIESAGGGVSNQPACGPSPMSRPAPAARPVLARRMTASAARPPAIRRSARIRRPRHEGAVASAGLDRAAPRAPGSSARRCSARGRARRRARAPSAASCREGARR